VRVEFDWDTRKGGPLGRPRYRWEDNIKMDLKGVGCDCVDWIYLAQDMNRWRTVVNTVMNFLIA
jgi:hypothetical protein